MISQIFLSVGFDPTDPFTTYYDVKGCGPRGINAQADHTLCPYSLQRIKNVERTSDRQVQLTLDGCNYYGWTSYLCPRNIVE